MRPAACPPGAFPFPSGLEGAVMTCQNHLSLSRAAQRASGGPAPVRIYFQGAVEEEPAQVLAAILRTANTVAGGTLRGGPALWNSAGRR